MITKRTLLISIVISLVIGGVAGFAIDRLVLEPNSSHFGKARFVSFMTQQLGLSKPQQRQLDSIITFVHPRFQSIRKTFSTAMKSEADSTQAMIRSILTPRQQGKLDALDKKMRGGSDNKRQHR